MATWFYMDVGEEVGPVTSDELRELARMRRIDAETFVRRDDSSEWMKATKIKGLLLPGADYTKDEPLRATPVAVDQISFRNAKSTDATRFCAVLIAIDTIWFLIMAIGPGVWLLYGLLGAIYFGLTCFAMGSLLRKNPAASLLIGMTFGIFGYAIIPFMPVVDEGAR